MRDFTEGKTRAKISRTRGNASEHGAAHITRRIIRADFAIRICIANSFSY
jgi:hypothetical protein